jgi:hypothetical protein
VRNDTPAILSLAILFALGGLVYGSIVAGLSLVMTGFGHGWREGLASSTAVVFAPLTGAGWVLRKTKAGSILAGLAFVGCIGVDLYLLRHTGSVDHVWQVLPFVFLIWLSLWLGIHAFAMYGMLWKTLKSE